MFKCEFSIYIKFKLRRKALIYYLDTNFIERPILNVNPLQNITIIAYYYLLMLNTLSFKMKNIKSLKKKIGAKKVVEQENVIYALKARNIFDDSIKKILQKNIR